MRSAWDATLLASRHPTDALRPSPRATTWRVVVGACMLGAGAARAVLLLVDRRATEHLPLVRTPPRLAVRAGIGERDRRGRRRLALALGAGGFAHREYDKFVHSTTRSPDAQTRERLTDPANDGRLPLWKARCTSTTPAAERHRRRHLPALLPPLSHRTTRTSSTPTRCTCRAWPSWAIVGFVLIRIVVLGMLAGLAARIRGPDRALYAALFARARLGRSIRPSTGTGRCRRSRSACSCSPGSRSRAPRRRRAGPLSGCPPAARSSRSDGSCSPSRHCSWAPPTRACTRAAQSSCAANCSAPARGAVLAVAVGQAPAGVRDRRRLRPAAGLRAGGRAGDEPRREPRYTAELGRRVLARRRARRRGPRPARAIDRAIALNPLEGGLRHAAEVLRSHDPRTWERAAPRLRFEALTSGKFAITNL